MNNVFQKTFKQGSTTYYNSSIFFPKKVKKDVFILYSFVRIADNFVDSIPQNAQGFNEFKTHYQQAVQGQPSNNTIIDSFVDLLHRKCFSVKWVNAFIHSMECDLSKTEYNTMEETLEYMYGSAEVIGLFMCRILNLQEQAEYAASMQGRAMQYINFIRDIKEDAELGRRYLPLTDSGLSSLTEPAARAAPGLFTSFIRREIERYKTWQDEANAGFHLIPKRLRIPIRTAADMYLWTAEKIWKNPFLIFQTRVKPSRTRILMQLVFNIFR
ncbi:MAG: phytoene/squalene synthase family protein [Spirochaetales bacterium]|nr:phytoene/squalene synthase family protein [Spirochaetales bacterium]